MTQEESKALNEIRGTGGYRVIEFSLKGALEDLNRVSDIDEDIHTSVEVQALGRKYAVIAIEKVLGEINVGFRPDTERSKTYE
jgi:hypothetical protein